MSERKIYRCQFPGAFNIIIILAMYNDLALQRLRLARFGTLIWFEVLY